MSIRNFVTLFLFLLACPALVRGNEICFVPNLAVNEQYNNNILLVTNAGNVMNDFITILSPGLDMTDRTARLDSMLSLRLDELYYARNNDLNATNQSYGGSVRYASTPLLNISADANYAKNSNPSLGIGTPSGNQKNGAESPPAPTQNLHFVSAPVQRITSSASMGYHMTEMTSFSAMYRFTWDSYSEPQYRDKTNEADAGLVIDLGKYLPRVSGRLNTGYTQFVLPEFTSTNVWGTIGFSYDISEFWHILVDAGLHRTETDTSANLPVFMPPTSINIIEQLEQTERGSTGQASLKYQKEYTNAELAFNQDFALTYLASGRQAPSVRRAYSFTGQQQITRELSAFVTAMYSTYTVANTITQRNIEISPLIRYELLQWPGERDLALEASYDHMQIDYPVSGRVHRDLVFIRLSLRFPKCSSSQYK